MPTAPPRPGRWPRCPALVSEPRERFCPTHRREHKRRIDRAYDQRRPTSAQRGYGANSRRLRAMVLAEEPLCRECLRQGRITPATDVDHIVPLAAGGTNDRSNLQALCHSCHSKKTFRDGGTVATR